VGSELETILGLIGEARRVLISSHENPDGDAIGSMLGLGLGLEKMGKEVVFYNKDGVPEILRFLPRSERIGNSINDIKGTFDLVFAVDCTGTNRAGVEFEDFLKSGRGGKVVIMDHHQTNGPSADYQLLNPCSSSTGIIVYSVLKRLPVEIDSDIAKNLYTTIIGDTGSFRYSNTNSETFRVAAELVERGANPAEISEALFESEPLRKLMLIGLVLPTLEVSGDKRVASVYVDSGMYSQSGARREDSEGIVNIPRSIKGIEVAALFKEESGKDGQFWKISLRSKGDVDVAKIAEGFGGGGHKKAAGCSIGGSLEDVKKRMFSAIEEALH
jgi:phosphoesterase RecJ-like protein